MNLFLDALYFEFEGGGGVGRIFREALPRALDLVPELSATAFSTGRLRGELPVHPRLKQSRISSLAHWSKAFSPGHLPWGEIPWAIRSRALGSALSESGPGIWHSTYYTLPRGWKGASLVILYDAIHERYPDLFPKDRAFPAHKAAALRSASHVACISESVRRDAVELFGLPESHTSVLYLAPGTSSVGEVAPFPSERPYLLFVGQRFAYKNFSKLLEALALWRGGTGVDLLCAGGPPFDAAEQEQIASRGLASRVRHLGHLGDRDLEAAYRGALCLVYPSLYEGFGIPVLEAYRAGVPVALSNTSSLPEVGGAAGFYFDPRDPSDMARALTEILGMSGAERALRVQAGCTHAAAFSWDATARQLATLYGRLA